MFNTSIVTVHSAGRCKYMLIQTISIKYWLGEKSDSIKSEWEIF
jgi:hypothetical protein